MTTPPPPPGPAATLCDAHRPRTTLGVLLSQTELGALRAWLRSPASSAPARVQAPPGSGITTAMQLLARELDMEPLWITPGVPQPKTLLCDAASSPVAVTGRRKLVVLDDFDALANDAQLLGEVSALARRGCECRVACVGRTGRLPKLDDLCRKWPHFKFARPPAKAVADRIAQVAAAERLQLTPEQALGLARAAGGDLRSALNSLDLTRRAPAPAEAAPTTEAGAPKAALPPAEAFVKDDTMDGLDVVARLLTSKLPLAEALRLGSLDPSVVPMGMFENFLDASSALCPQASEYFSVADVVEKRAYAGSCWDLLDVHAALAIAGPHVAIERRRDPPEPKKFGIVWSKMYNACAKAKGLRGVQTARAEAGLTHMGVCDLAYVRALVQAALAAGDDDALRAATHGLPPAQVLALMRLWKTEYKASTHARVKKLLA